MWIVAGSFSTRVGCETFFEVKYVVRGMFYTTAVQGQAQVKHGGSSYALGPIFVLFLHTFLSKYFKKLLYRSIWLSLPVCTFVQFILSLLAQIHIERNQRTENRAGRTVI